MSRWTDDEICRRCGSGIEHHTGPRLDCPDDRTTYRVSCMLCSTEVSGTAWSPEETASRLVGNLRNHQRGKRCRNMRWSRGQTQTALRNQWEKQARLQKAYGGPSNLAELAGLSEDEVAALVRRHPIQWPPPHVTNYDALGAAYGVAVEHSKRINQRVTLKPLSRLAHLPFRDSPGLVDQPHPPTQPTHRHQGELIMARTTYVKKAQQRYATVPVLNEDGTQKTVPVLSKRTGEQKVTKSGKPVVKRLTRRDTSQPLPMPKCDYPKCKHEDRSIKVGEPYKHITPKSGPYGGRTRYRHGDCPGWQVWDYSNSLSARIQRIQYDYDEALDDVTTDDDVTEALGSAAEAVRELAEEKREGAQNIEQGFGHPTSQSEDLEQQADELDQWADEIETASVPAPGDYPCTECDGDGEVGCTECDENHTDQDAWLEAVRDEVTVVEDSPL